LLVFFAFYVKTSPRR